MLELIQNVGMGARSVGASHQQTVKFTVAARLVTGALVEAWHTHSQRSSPKLRHLSVGLCQDWVEGVKFRSAGSNSRR
jgi:hypothetical protein